MADQTKKTRNHPAWQRKTMPADVRALGKSGEFIAHAIRKQDNNRRSKVRA